MTIGNDDGLMSIDDLMVMIWWWLFEYDYLGWQLTMMVEDDDLVMTLRWWFGDGHLKMVVMIMMDDGG